MTIIIRDFTVDLSVTGMDAIRATRRNFYGNEKVVENMPRATTSSGQILFFNLSKYVTVRDLLAEYEKRGRIPVDPHTLCAFNAANPDFAYIHPNCTQWVDEEDRVCFEAFRRWDVKSDVAVYQRGRVWGGTWWFAGVSK